MCEEYNFRDLLFCFAGQGNIEDLGILEILEFLDYLEFLWSLELLF